MSKLIIVLGDQLDADSHVFDDIDARNDTVWMAEVQGETRHVWNHKARVVLFLSAMRHFAADLRKRGYQVHYHTLDDGEKTSLSDVLEKDLAKLKPQEVVLVEPGAWRMQEAIQETVSKAGMRLDILPDKHFMCSKGEFASHAKGRKQLRMEFFYREMRKKYDVLMRGGKPEGDAWNFDKENRGAFSKEGPGSLPRPLSFAPDQITKEVMALVEKVFPEHPGRLDQFDWPVTREHALLALDDFIKHRLPQFGQYQDAMWTDEPFLYHAMLSTSLNLKLLNPREVIAAAEKAYRDDPGTYPLNAVEGFIRQILGWREYVRGVYWMHMPGYLERNELKADRSLPSFYWTGETDMNCLKLAIGQTLDYGYAHHIQRLMVTGLYALLYGVDPVQVHEWYLAVYVDAVEWVELPNTLGMSQYADGGVMASKPYVATGKYIDRMSNYCRGCRFKPAKRTGEDACPFTTLYWDFLLRHQERLAGNQRMRMQLRNLERLSDADKEAIQSAASRLTKAGKA